jgi:predicted NBD/HSP70 family sugar kinase
LATVEHQLPSVRPDPATVVAQLASGLREVIAKTGVDERSVIGVGIGVPGAVEQGDSADGVRVHAQTIGWDAVPFGKLLRDSGITLPLYFENGAKTQGQAEMWFGAGRGCGHAVIALIGSGIGAAVITDGSTYRGATSSAGEWGHTTIAYVGAESILDRYRQARGGRAVTGADEHASLDALVAAAGRSRTAAKVLQDTAGYLGAGIANLINLFNPEKIVVGGWAGLALGAKLLPDIREAAAAHALHHAYGQTSIELCQLGPDAVAFGAATLPVATLLARGGDPRESAAAARPAKTSRGRAVVSTDAA